MKKNMSYDEKAHRFGRMSLIVGTLATTIFALLLIFVFHVPVNGKAILSGIGSIMVLMIPTSLTEFLSLSPMIGTSAMYIMVLTGNYSNLKIPASIAAMESVGLDPANYTEESDVISTISMAVSAVTSILVIIIGVLLFVPLQPVLSSPVLKPAFDNVVSALFGALGVSMIAKNYKLGAVPFVLGIVLLKLGLGTSLTMPILILAGVLTARIMYKKNWVK
ncbi:MAG: hypothetical protein ACI4PT_12135 [Candidatus Avoscillospira sp.]